MDFSNQNIAIYSCQFQAFVEKAKVQIKFPCNYFLQWKANNGKVIVSSANRYTANKSQILFNESLQINVNILYDRINKKYLKKESLLMINLISKSRPDQIKLVGRVVVDLADVLNGNSFDKLTTAQLEYCSVEATVNFSIRSISVKQSTMHVSELDRSSFNEYMSFQANFKPQLVHRNEGSSTHRDFDEVGSAKGSQQKQIRSLGRDKNKMSSPSLSKQAFTPSNKSQSRIIQSAMIQQKMNRSNSIPNQIQKPTSKLNSPQSEVPLTQNQNNFSFHKNNQEEQGGKVQSSLNGYGRVRGSIMGMTGQGKALGSGLGGNAQQREGSMLVTFKEQGLGVVTRTQQLQTKRSGNSIVGNGGYQGVANNTGNVVNSINSINTVKGNIANNTTPSLDTATLPNPNLPLPISPTNNPTDQSFTSTTKQPNIKRHSLQLSRSNQQSRRILGLTQALNQLQQKYTKLTLQNQEMRATYKRQKEQLVSNISRGESILLVRDNEVREKTQVIDMLKQSNRVLEVTSNERLAEMIYLKSQLNQSNNQKTKLEQQNKLLQQNITSLHQQLNQLNSQSSLTSHQLNQSFAQRLTIYQQNCTTLQHKLKEQQLLVKQLNQSSHILQQKTIKLQQQNNHYFKQIQQAHSQLFTAREEVQMLRTQLKTKQLMMKQGMTKQEKVQQMARVIRQKQQQLLLVKQHLQQYQQQFNTERQQLQSHNQHLLQQNQQLQQHLTQITHTKIDQYTAKEQQYTAKINQLQNTILRLSDQQQSELSTKLIQSQNTLLSLNQQLVTYQQQLNSYKNRITLLQQQSKTSQQQHITKQSQQQQLILNLNTQIEQQRGRTLQLQELITSLNDQIAQLTTKITQEHHCHQQYIQQTTQSLSSLQLLKTQLSIYQTKFQQQQYMYHQQMQTMKLQYTQQCYQLQIQLQELGDKYHELEQINNLLKVSIEEWQTKWTQDRLNNTRMVQRLNEIIVEKEGVMSEMDVMMRQLEREKEGMGVVISGMQERLREVTNSYRAKVIEMRRTAQQEQVQLALLYNQVKQQRNRTTTMIQQKQSIIHKLTTQSQHLTTTITHLTTTNQTLSHSLSTKQLQLQQSQQQLHQQLLKIKNQHNTQIDQYEERIRELNDVVGQRDNQLLQKEMVVCDLQRERDGLVAVVEGKSQQVSRVLQQKQQLQNKYNQQLNAIQLKQQQLSILSQQLLNLKQTILQYQSKYTMLQTSFIQCQQSQASKVTSLQHQKSLLQQQLSQLTNRIAQLCQVITSKQNQLIQVAQQHQHALTKKQQQLQLNLQQALQQQQLLNQQQLSQLKHQQSSLRQQLQSRLLVLQQQINSNNQLLLQKTTLAQSIQHQKQQLINQLQSIKSERQTIMLISYKQQLERYKRTVSQLQQQLIQVRNQAAKIPSLERTIKIKTIELNSFKYKVAGNSNGNSSSGGSNNNNSSNTNGNNNNSNTTTNNHNHNQHSSQQIIKLQSQQIQQLKLISTRIKDLQLLTYQLQATNLQLNQSIEQYQQQKFLLHSQLNQSQIKLQQQLNTIQSLQQHKQQLKDKLNEMTEKLNYYEGLIMDFRGHDMSTTKSQSDKINNSRGSSNKVINQEGEQKGDNIAHKLQLETFVKKIKLLEGEVSKHKLKEEELLGKEGEYMKEISMLKSKIVDMQNTIAAKQQQLSKHNTITTKPTPPATRPKGQIIRNPQQITQSSKQLQSLLKKRNQFYNLESLLTKISTMKDSHSESMTKDKEEDQKIKDKILCLTGNVSNLMKEFQNVKTRIMKLEGKNYQQKAKIISLIRPFQDKILQTVKLSSGQIKTQTN